MLKENLLRPLYVVLLITTMFVTTGCQNNTVTPSDASTCGTATTKSMSYVSPFVGHFPDTYTLGSMRFYDFYIEVDSICTDTHTNSTFSTTSVETPGRPMSFVASVEWSLFFERRDTGSFTITPPFKKWTSSIPNVGFKQQFGEDAGACFINVNVSFTSLGSRQADSIWLVNNLNVVQAEMTYNFHKPETAEDISLDPESYKDFPLTQIRKSTEMTSLLIDAYRKEKEIPVLKFQ